MMEIKENKIKCSKCNDVVVSVIEDVFKSCVCGNIKIAGGTRDKIRIKADGIPAVLGEDYVDLSTYIFND